MGISNRGGDEVFREHLRRSLVRREPEPPSTPVHTLTGPPAPPEQRRRILGLWEEVHGQLDDRLRAKFLERPEATELAACDGGVLSFVFSREKRLARCLPLARAIQEVDLLWRARTEGDLRLPGPSVFDSPGAVRLLRVEPEALRRILENALEVNDLLETTNGVCGLLDACHRRFQSRDSDPYVRELASSARVHALVTMFNSRLMQAVEDSGSIFDLMNRLERPGLVAGSEAPFFGGGGGESASYQSGMVRSSGALEAGLGDRCENCGAFVPSGAAHDCR